MRRVSHTLSDLYYPHLLLVMGHTDQPILILQNARIKVKSEVADTHGERVLDRSLAHRLAGLLMGAALVLVPRLALICAQGLVWV